MPCRPPSVVSWPAWRKQRQTLRHAAPGPCTVVSAASQQQQADQVHKALPCTLHAVPLIALLESVGRPVGAPSASLTAQSQHASLHRTHAASSGGGWAAASRAVTLPVRPGLAAAVILTGPLSCACRSRRHEAQWIAHAGDGGGGGGGSSGTGGSGGGGDDDNDGKQPAEKKVFGWKGWQDRVAADPQFVYKVVIEQVIGVSASVIGDMASRPNWGLNELDFVFATLVVSNCTATGVLLLVLVCA